MTGLGIYQTDREVLQGSLNLENCVIDHYYYNVTDIEYYLLKVH